MVPPSGHRFGIAKKVGTGWEAALSAVMPELTPSLEADIRVTATNQKRPGRKVCDSLFRPDAPS